MNRLDELTDLLEARGDAADGLHPDLGDVRSRARRQHRSTVIVGAVATIAAVAGVATAVVASTGDDGAGQRVGTADTADQPDPPASLAPFRRTYADGHVVTARQYDPGTFFGPFGDDHEWTAGPDCASGIQFDVAEPATGPLGEGSGGSGGVVTRDRAIAEAVTWDYATSGSDTSIPAFVAVVPDAQAGASYRLVVDGGVVDTARADGNLLLLAGPGPEQPKSPSDQQLSLPIEERDHDVRPEASIQPSVDASLQRLDDQGTVVEDETLPTALAYSPPASCTTPPDPTGVGPASPVDSQDPDDIALRDIVSLLAPTSGNTSAVLPHVDDADGSLSGIGGSGVPANMAAGAREVHRDSPTHAWVKWGFQLGGTDVTAPTPDVFVGWVEANKVDGQWLLTEDSYCAFASGPVGPKCPGAPRYRPISASGVSGLYVTTD